MSEPTVQEPATQVTQVAAAPAEPAVPAPRACPRCGAALREDQDWCLNCGAAVSSRVAAPTGWRAPLAVAGVVLALALAGLLVAFLAVSDDSDELTRLAAQGATTEAPPPAPTPAPPAPTPAPTGTPGAGATVPDATGEEGSDLPGLESLPEASGGSDEGDGGATVGSWPAGRSAFTVVVLSTTIRERAERRARELARGGTDVGLLESDDFASLPRGRVLVFAGQYDSRDAAQDALRGLREDAPGASVRRIRPR